MSKHREKGKLLSLLHKAQRKAAGPHIGEAGSENWKIIHIENLKCHGMKIYHETVCQIILWCEADALESK